MKTESDGKGASNATKSRWKTKTCAKSGKDLRLSVLGTRGLAARLAAASHFECGWFGFEKIGS